MWTLVEIGRCAEKFRPLCSSILLPYMVPIPLRVTYSMLKSSKPVPPHVPMTV